MQNGQPERIAIRMSCQEMPDGRTFASSPDLMAVHAATRCSRLDRWTGFSAF